MFKPFQNSEPKKFSFRSRIMRASLSVLDNPSGRTRKLLRAGNINPPLLKPELSFL